MYIKPSKPESEAHPFGSQATLIRTKSHVFYKKICVMGGFAVGKSSLLRRYVNKVFHNNYTGTVGVHLYRQNIIQPAYEFNLFFWDLSGILAYTEPQQDYLRGAAAGILVCDVTRQGSLAEIEPLYAQWREIHATKPIILLANKIDAVDKIILEQETVVEKAQQLNIPVVFCSAKSGAEVDQAFGLIVRPLVHLSTNPA